MQLSYFKSIIVILGFIFFPLNLIIANDQLPPKFDASRIKPQSDLSELNQIKPSIPIVKKLPDLNLNVPSEAKNFKFKLKQIKLEGNTTLDLKLVEAIYLKHLNKVIDLSVIYAIANEITALYKKQGYFASLAQVPQQKISISKGIATITIIEGYIKKIELPKETEKYNNIIFNYVSFLLAEKPISVKSLESALLKINDLFEYKFKGILTGANDLPNGELKLTLTATPKKSKTIIMLDNYLSKVLGPHEVSFLKKITLSPFQQLAISGSTNPLGFNNLNQLSLNYAKKINNKVSFDIIASFARTLADLGINDASATSRSKSIATEINYELIRQRDHNLKTKMAFNLRNSSNYIMEILSSQDRIRSIKLGLSYDFNDQLQNYYNLNFNLIKGINCFNASKKNGSLNSRNNAKPNFSKIEINGVHVRYLNEKFSLLLSSYAQYAYTPLYAAEEFGYGGQTIGKAFDNSEITGDHGVAGLIQLNYNNLTKFANYKLIPYFLYDVGIVWRRDPHRKNREIASSIGGGVSFDVVKNFEATCGLFFPLIKKIANPIYGNKMKSFRFSFKISAKF